MSASATRTRKYPCLAMMTCLMALSPACGLNGGVISDFNDGVPDWAFGDHGSDLVGFEEVDGHLVITATGLRLWDTVSWKRALPVDDGHAVEVSLDLLGSTGGSLFFFGIEGGTNPDVGEGFYLAKTPGNVRLVKYRNTYDSVTRQTTGVTLTELLIDQVELKHFNVRLLLAITGLKGRLHLTIVVQDGDDTLTTLYERTMVTGAPFTSAHTAWLGLVPTATSSFPDVVTVDNFEYRLSGPPPVLGIEKAVRLSWEGTLADVMVEGAPTTDGPWTPVSGRAFEDNGTSEVWVATPLSEAMKIFRLKSIATP